MIIYLDLPPANTIVPRSLKLSLPNYRTIEFNLSPESSDAYYNSLEIEFRFYESDNSIYVFSECLRQWEYLCQYNIVKVLPTHSETEKCKITKDFFNQHRDLLEIKS